MDIKVKVPSKRKCSASIDVIDRNLALLSFGDLETPETDVEVEFTLDQLKELKNVADKSIEDWEKNLEDWIVEALLNLTTVRCYRKPPPSEEAIGVNSEIAKLLACREKQINFTHCNLCHNRFKCWTI